MDVSHATARFAFLPVRLRIVPRQVLKLPALSKTNTLRGAFGMAFRRLVCIPQCREVRQCPLAATCPYRIIFEPAPPPGAERLSKNQDIPRPFIFRPPLNTATTYPPGQAFDFTLTLMGKAVDFLPYFILAFREVAREGIGLNRARCELDRVEALLPPPPDAPAPGPRNEALIYTQQDDLFRSPPATRLEDWVAPRLRAMVQGEQHRNHHAAAPSGAADSGPLPPPSNRPPALLTIRFLTPTYLKSEGQPVRQPEFHHLFKRVRDRLNALSTFYGPGPIDADFKGLGKAAEKVRTIKCDVHWQERSRRSSKTGQRHELSGFVGQCVYDLSTVDCQLSAANSLLPWILCGELIHAGRHTAWGNGWYHVGGESASSFAEPPGGS